MCSTAHYCLCPQNIVWLLIFRLTTCFLVLLLPYNCLLCWKHKQRKCCFVSLVYLCFYKWNPQSIQSIWMCFTKNRWTVVAQLWGCILNAGIIISGLSTLCIWCTHRHTHMQVNTLLVLIKYRHTHMHHTLWPQAIIWGRSKRGSQGYWNVISLFLEGDQISNSSWPRSSLPPLGLRSKWTGSLW